MLNNPLLDKEFLNLLDANRERETYARIVALSFQEEPLEQIEGRVTQGTINVDGNSAVRRTCSLTLVAQDLNINDFYWGLKSKFKLEVGIRNTIKDVVYNDQTGETWGSKYPQDIIWFPQGIYIITTFNTSQNTTSYTVSISGKDKMCLLNGDLGGSLIASIDFGMEEYYDKEHNITTYTPIPIQKIIKEMVHAYGLEPYYNIIINDLDETPVELLEYRGDVPLYMLYDIEAGSYTNFTTNGDTPCKDESGNATSLNNIVYNPRVDLVDDITNPPTKITFEGSPKIYTVAKIEFGQTAGYRLTELTYAGELISNIGESITSILDKIKKMLGEYEYFYDTDGRFVFQRKRNHIQQTWNSIVKIEEDKYVENSANTSAVMYNFKNNNLITSFSNSPKLSNLKNDYSVWGERTGISGIKIPVHYRYAIDIKPEKYVSLRDRNKPGYETTTSKTYTDKEYDWRELIFRMAEDHHAYSQYDWYIEELIEQNPETCFNGTTGYEQYYVDLLGFWRELYDYNESTGKLDWTETVKNDPSQLNFWFDFLDANSELGQFSTKAVGDRVKAVNDTAVTAIYFREVPDLIFVPSNNNSDLTDISGYTKVLVTGSLENMFNISSQGKSAQNLIDELVYSHSYCIESVTIQSVPIYHLQPNVRISVEDKVSKIQGEYIISKLTIPLAYNGTMSITATKAPERIT